MKTEFGIALKEKPLDEGLTKAEVMDLFDMLLGVRAIPVEFQGEHSSAMGFINLTDAEILDFKYYAGSDLYMFIQDILNDMEKESDDGEYEFDNGNIISIYLGR